MLSARSTISKLFPACARIMSTGEPGSGAGRGGGGGGSIRDAGGAFGKMEVAHEEEYFYKQRQEQLHKLKLNAIKKEEFHEDAIKQHEEAIQRHKQQIGQK